MILHVRRCELIQYRSPQFRFDASQASNISPGPEDSCTWSSTDLTQNVQCNYHFPAGSSDQLIQITQPSRGAPDLVRRHELDLEQSWTSATTTFTAKLYVRDDS